MKKLIFLLTLLISTTALAQNDLLYVEGLAYKVFTTAQLDALSTKVEGDAYYDSDKKTTVVWDGTQWKSGGGTVHIDGQSPINSFDFALGTWAQLQAASFDANTVLIPTDNNGDFVTTDGYVTGLSFGLVGSNLTLTATRNGLSNVVSNTIALPSGGASDHGALTGLADDDHPQYLTQAEGDARYLQLTSYEVDEFTPALVDNGGGATYSASVSSGDYVKVGDQVTFTIFFNIINTTSSPSGELRITGLPYTAMTGANFSCNVSTYTGGNVSFYSISAEVISNTSTIYFRYQDSLDANLSSNMSSVTFSGGSIRLTGTYIAQ